MTSLVEKSVLQRTPDARFAYLETIREYALEQFAETPATDEIRRRHFHYFLKLAEAADLSAVRRRGRERLDVAQAARDNLRAALAWSLETDSISLGLELASAMERYWVTHDPREGMRWFAALLSHPAAGAVEPALLADALRAHGSATDIAGDDEAAHRLYERSLALFEQLGDEHGRAVLLHRLGICAMRRGDLDLARRLVETSHAIHEQSNNHWGQAQTIGTLGAIARDSGDRLRAAELIEMSAAMAREAGVGWWESGMLAELAALALHDGDIDGSGARARVSLTLAADIDDRAGRIFGVGLFAAIAAARGENERAEQLWAAVAEEDAVAPLGGWRRHRPDVQAHIEHYLGRPLQLHDEPSAPLDDAVALALRPPSRLRSSANP